MKRKLVLLLGTFILLLFAFGVYQLFVPGIAIFDPKTRGIKPDFSKIRPGAGPQIGETSEVRIVARNAEGQIRGIYKVASWTKENDDSFTLITPTAVVYLKGGKRAYVSAERGRIWASEVHGGIDVRNGFFEGNVNIYFDQSTDLNRKHPAEREHDKVMEECISIFTNDIRFSRDMLEIKTDSRVVVWSKMLDIVGEGLLLRWNEDPRELRLLRIDKGELMVVKDLPENMDLMQMTKPGDTKAKTVALSQAESDTTETPVTTSKPAEVKEVLATTRPAETSSEIAATAPLDDDGFGVELLTSEEVPVGAPDVTSKRKKPTVRNKYKATFNDAVRVHSGTQRLTGAEQVAIFFEWDELAWRESQEKQEKKKTAASQPAGKSAGNLAEAEKETRTASADKRKMEIHWDGPMEISPFGTVPEPDLKRFKVLGTGKRILLADADTEMACICSEFEVQNPRTSAFFRANRQTKTPVFLTVSGREIITCDDHIRCDVEEIEGVRGVQTFMIGSGQARTFDTKDSSFLLNPDELDEPEQQARQYDRRVSWGKNAEVILDIADVTTDSGERKKRPRIQKVIAEQDVEVIMMPVDKNATEITDYIKCGLADVEFANLPDGRNYLKKAYASNNISALMDSNAITAREVTVYFKEPAKDKQPKPEATEDKKELIKGIKFDIENVSRMIANGNIKIWYKDPKRPETPESQVEGESLDVLLDPTEAGKSSFRGILTGNPAKVFQGDEGIEGNLIQFNSEKEILQVSGPGKLSFTTDRDLNGNKLTKPWKLKVNWSRSLLAYGQGGYAIADGDVNVMNDSDVLQCDQARLFFEKKTDNAVAQKKSETDDKKSRWSSMGIGLPSFGSDGDMKFTQLEAHGGMGEQKMVLMRSRTMNPLNPLWLQRRIELTGKTLIFRPLTQQAESKGNGTLLVEDYRHPEEKTETKTGSSPLAGGKLERPSQTVFTWKDRMTIDQADKHVTLWGDVSMRHFSGNKVIPLGEDKTEPWGTLKKGQTISLSCNQMDAYFDEPTDAEKAKRKTESKDGSKSLMDSGPQLGTLKHFKAFKDVTFAYDQSKIDGQNIDYFGPTKTLIIEGFLPGDKKLTNAHYEFTDPNDGRPRSFDCPRIIVNNLGEPNETFKLDKMEGKGAR